MALYIISLKYGEDPEQIIALFGDFEVAFEELNNIPEEDFSGHNAVLILSKLDYGFQFIKDSLIEGSKMIHEKSLDDNKTKMNP